MPTITVRLDKERASRLSRWARRRKVTKSEVVRQLIDRVETIQTGEDLIAWVEANQGKDFGLGR
jgi:predicted transcriptional regulator